MSSANHTIRIPENIREHIGIDESDKIMWYKQDDDSVVLKTR